MQTCDLCPRTSKTHTIGRESGICNACDAVLRYWHTKTPRQVMRRARQIDSFQNRMEVLLGAIKQPRKRKRAA